MASVTVESNLASIQGPGKVMVVTDLHGNLDDFHRTRIHFERLWDASPDDARPVMIIVGDLFHGPTIEKHLWPAQLGTYYIDRSVELFRELRALLADRPESICILLGNHDHAHIGGPITSKFRLNEARHLESCMQPDEVERLRDFIRTFPLAARTAGNVFMTHAAAPVLPLTEERLGRMVREGYEYHSPMAFLHKHTLGQILWRRTATKAETLASIQALTGHEHGVHIHGHVVAPLGRIWPNPHELCVSTSFGLFDENKLLAILDNETLYRDADKFELAGCLVDLFERH